jgi:hypothetical protein
MSSRLEYLKKIKKRYLKATKQEKTEILDEYCQNTGHNRKYIIRRLSARISLAEPQAINRKRKHTYTNEDIYCLSKIWEIMDYPCGQRLQPNLGEIIDILVKNKELNIPENMAAKLKCISSTTINDRLKPYRVKLRRKINSTTKPGSLVKKQIPVRTSSWNEQRIGCSELDTVPHCGESAQGDFINSLNLADILTGWTETIAIMGKAQNRIIAGLDDIKTRLPFPLLAIDPDNGSEFINWQLFRWCMEKQIEFTRGRPYQKNDNAHIEQKNWTHVRKVFGYQRRETEEELKIMNDLYRNELRLYKNFFMPNVKLIAKKRTGEYGEKIKRIYDQAKTPYQRVLACDQVNDKTRLKLKEQYEQLNPAELRRQILAKLDKLNKINRTIAITAKQKVTFSTVQR